MRKTTHLKIFMLGVFGAFLTFRKEIHDFTRIDIVDTEETELEKQLVEYRTKFNIKTTQEWGSTKITEM